MAPFRCPDCGRRPNTDRIDHAQLGDVVTKGGFVTITGIRQHDVQPDPRMDRATHLRQGDFRLDGEGKFRRNTGSLASFRVGRPLLRKVVLVMMGKLPWALASDRLTAPPGSCPACPNWPQYYRVTPTECLPFFGNPVSSMIQ
jgi:hypothetical protein